MAITKERFEQGLTYDTFVKAMTKNQERLEEAASKFNPRPEDVAAFKKLPKPLNVIAIGEDWCGDVLANFPIVERLAKESGKLNVRVFLRDQNEDLMNQYLNKGEFKSIPVFAFFDESFKEIGNFKERPESVTKLRAGWRAQIAKEHPEVGAADAPTESLTDEQRAALQGYQAKLREETRDWANNEVVRELRAIVERA